MKRLVEHILTCTQIFCGSSQTPQPSVTLIETTSTWIFSMWLLAPSTFWNNRYPFYLLIILHWRLTIQQSKAKSVNKIFKWQKLHGRMFVWMFHLQLWFSLSSSYQPWGDQNFGLWMSYFKLDTVLFITDYLKTIYTTSMMEIFSIFLYPLLTVVFITWRNYSTRYIVLLILHSTNVNT